MKRILFIVLIFLLHSCTGYKPIYSNKNINFRIAEINNLNNDFISKEIIKSLKPYTTGDNKIEILLEIKSEKSESIISRDSKGDPLISNFCSFFLNLGYIYDYTSLELKLIIHDIILIHKLLQGNFKK